MGGNVTENYVSTKVKAEEWGMSLRTVQHACKDGRVPGAKKVNKEWLVPINAMSPIDARTAKGRTIKALGIDFREKEKFVTDTWTSVIHNVRNALSTIMGYADLIRLKEGDTERYILNDISFKYEETNKVRNPYGRHGKKVIIKD